MNAIQNFAFEEHLVRVVDRDGAPWFVANDVCRALELSNPRKAVADLDEDERGVTTSDTPGGEQLMNIVSEPGVYRLVFRSRKPEAERFKRWLAHEVLPQIRKTGRYETGAPVEPLPTLDNSSVAVWRAKIDLVREARIQFGAARARHLWSTLGLPDVPGLPAASRIDAAEAADCLAHLLARPVNGIPVRDRLAEALAGEDEDAVLLSDFGIRIARRRDGLLIATNSQGIDLCFAATRWAYGAATAALRALPGAHPYGTVRYGSHSSRATFVPIDHAGL